MMDASWIRRHASTRWSLIIYQDSTSLLSFPLLFILASILASARRRSRDSRDEGEIDLITPYEGLGITRSFQFLRREKEKRYFEHFVESRRWNEIYSASLTVLFYSKQSLLPTFIREITVLSDIANFFETFRTIGRDATLRTNVSELKINKNYNHQRVKNSSDYTLNCTLASVLL